MTLFLSVLGYILLSLFFLIVVLLLLPLGISARYDKDIYLSLRLLFFTFRILPAKEKKEEVKKGKKVKKRLPEDGRPAHLLDDMRAGIGDFLEAAGALKRGVIIDYLSLDILIASDDPAVTGIGYGTTCASAALLIPVIENNFAVKKSSILVDCDFTGKSGHFKAEIILHIRLWRLALIAFKLFMGSRKSKKNLNKAVSV